MLSVQAVSLHVGAHQLLDHANLTVHPGQKVGLIGKNGAGKSTLLKAILGDLSIDHGQVDLPSGWLIGHVEQEIKATEQVALDYVIAGDSEYADIQSRIQLAEHSNNQNQLIQAYDDLDKSGGYHVPQKAKQLLFGLGFVKDTFNNQVKEFSGGWQVRLKLAKALMQKSDLLLLDEPTNHLDIEAVSWLVQWLKSYEGAIVAISHDRHFLDEVVGGIAEISEQKIHLYSGNFAAYERQKNERLMQQQALFDKQKQQMQHLKTFIERFKAKASKAKQAQSRVKALQRMESVAAVQASNPFQFQFINHEVIPDPMLKVESLTFGYDSASIIENAELVLRAGDRIGLVGVNGSGKSTLLKLMVKELQPQSGKIVYAKGLKIGYFAQHQLESLQLEQSPLQHLLRLSRQLDEYVSQQLTDQQARDFLGQFGFSNDKALQAVSHFSGGEKARLSLALMIFQKPNLVILDEPTNHLDMETRDALDLALQEFTGALILVSHDQHLLSSLVDQYWWVHEKQVEHFHGSLEEYLQQRLNIIRQKNAEDVSGQNLTPDSSKKAQRQQSAQLRKQIREATAVQTKRIKQIEKQLAEKQHRADEILSLMEDSGLYDSDQSQKLMELTKEQSQINQDIEVLEEEWLLLESEVEEIMEGFVDN